MEYLTFHNGQKMPVLGLGTFLSSNNEVKNAVSTALECGYRHIDTAYSYLNEEEIGEALQEWLQSGKVKREELFIVTKLPMIGNRAEDVERYLKMSLDKLKLDYVDLYLIHFPAGLESDDDKVLFPTDSEGNIIMDKSTDHLALWKAMEAQVDNGRTKSIGLSNFNRRQIERVWNNCRIKPANLQVEVHAYFQQTKLIEYCHSIGLTVCAYAPFGSPGRVVLNPSGEFPDILKNPVVAQIAASQGKSPSQVLLRHLIHKGIAVIPKSVNAQRIGDNFHAMDFTLSPEEIAQLDQLDLGTTGRSFDFKIFKGLVDHPEYPFLDDY